MAMAEGRRVKVISSHVAQSVAVAAICGLKAESVLGVESAKVHSSFTRVALVGAPVCKVEFIAGVKKAPDAIRAGGLEAVVKDVRLEFEDHGDVPSEDNQVAALPPAVQDATAYYAMSFVRESLSLGRSIAMVHERASAAAADGKFVLTVGGDHGVASGSISGVMRHRPDLAVVWVDAFGNCNTPDTSPSQNYHGMPLAHLLGWFQKSVAGFEWLEEHQSRCGPLKEARVAMIALRNVDPPEREMLKDSGVHVYSMTDIDRHGIGEVMEMALQYIDPKGQRPLHLSFDIDGCDPEIAPGTSMKIRGGLSYREAHYICERLASTGRLGSMDIVEINPDADTQTSESMHGDNPIIKGSETVRLGLELISSALGKTIA